MLIKVKGKIMDNNNLEELDINNILRRRGINSNNSNRTGSNHNLINNQAVEDFLNYTNNIQTINIEELANRFIILFDELIRNYNQEELLEEGFFREFNDRLSQQRFWREINQRRLYEIMIEIDSQIRRRRRRTNQEITINTITNLRNRNILRNPTNNTLNNNDNQQTNTLRNRFNNLLNETNSRFRNGINRIRNNQQTNTLRNRFNNLLNETNSRFRNGINRIRNNQQINTLRNRFNNLLNETNSRFRNGINRIRNLFRNRNNEQVTNNNIHFENELSVVVQRDFEENSNSINNNGRLDNNKQFGKLLKIIKDFSIIFSHSSYEDKNFKK